MVAAIDPKRPRNRGMAAVKSPDRRKYGCVHTPRSRIGKKERRSMRNGRHHQRARSARVISRSKSKNNKKYREAKKTKKPERPKNLQLYLRWIPLLYMYVQGHVLFYNNRKSLTQRLHGSGRILNTVIVLYVTSAPLRRKERVTYPVKSGFPDRKKLDPRQKTPSHRKEAQGAGP